MITTSWKIYRNFIILLISQKTKLPTLTPINTYTANLTAYTTSLFVETFLVHARLTI